MSKQYISIFSDSKNPHDEYFRRTLIDNPELTKEFIQCHLPKDLLSQINLEKIEHIPLELFKGMGGKIIGDLALKTKLNNKDMYIILAIEHQSSNEHLMALRMLEYLVHILIQHVEEQKEANIAESKIRLPFVYQTVVYHGRNKCTMKNDIRDLVDAPRELIENYFLKPFQLIDFTKINNEDLKQQHLAGLFGLGLKYIFSKKQIEIKELFNMLYYFTKDINILNKSNVTNIFGYVLEYMITRLSNDNYDVYENIIEIIKKLPEDEEVEIMTVAEMLKQQGLEQGLEQGKNLGRLDGELDLLTRQITRKFGNISALQLAKLKKLNADQLLEIGEKLLDAKSFEDLMKWY